MKRILLIISLLLPACLHLSADPVAEAEKYCKSKDYTAAISTLREAIDRQGASAELYHDLGNAYYRAGNFGGAVLNFRRALILNPSQSESENNLKATQADVQRLNEANMGDSQADPTPDNSNLVSSLKSAIASPGSNFWCILSIVLFIAGVIAVAVYLLVKHVATRKICFFGGGILVLLSLLALLFSWYSRSRALSGDSAVIVAKEISLKTSPAADAKPVATPLVCGTELKVLGSQKGTDGKPWTHVYLNSDFSGWVPAADIEIISVPGLK